MVYSVFLWRKGFRQDNRVNYFLLLLGFIFHTTAMAKRGFSLKECPVNNLRSDNLHHLDNRRGVFDYRYLASAAISGRVRIAGRFHHRSVRADARARSAARSQA